MARSRNIKPGFFLNEKLGECPSLARLLFAGLWCHADREGRLENRPKKIKAEILPYDDCDVSALLAALESHGFTRLYTAEHVPIIQIVNFLKHQNPHPREPKSLLPAMESREKKFLATDFPEPAGPLIPLSSNLNPSNPLPVNGLSKMNGTGVSGRIWSAEDRNAYAVKEAIPFLPGGDDGERWAVAMAAEDPSDPNHRKAVTAMLAATKKAKVGWVSPERRKR